MPLDLGPGLAAVCYYLSNSKGPRLGSVSRAGEHHLPGSDEMSLFVPATASQLYGSEESQLVYTPSQDSTLTLVQAPPPLVTTWHLKTLVTSKRNFLRVSVREDVQSVGYKKTRAHWHTFPEANFKKGF